MRKMSGNLTRTASTGTRLQFYQSQVFHRKLRNQGCSFTRDWIGAVASRCFLNPTLSLASAQIWKDPRDANVEVRRVDLANWALWTSSKVTTWVKYQFHQGFWPDQRSGNPIILRPLQNTSVWNGRTMVKWKWSKKMTNKIVWKKYMLIVRYKMSVLINDWF